MKQISSAVLGLALAMATLAGVARAQINSPPPPLGGQPSFHIYTVPGVTGNGILGAYFACTNTTSANIRVGVEIFGAFSGPAFNDASASSIEVFPGNTATFGTTGSNSISVLSVLGGVPDTGSARILATKKSGIICSAFLADPTNAPPTSMVKLTVVKKTKQNGE